MKKIVFLALLLASGPLQGIAEGATIKVCPSGCTYTSIQAGIDAAAEADVIMVGDGTYHERIDFKNKAITVVSEHGAAATVIDGDRAGRVVTMTAPYQKEAVLNGFTLQNGSIPTENGGGVSAQNAALLNCTVKNSIGFHGGGVFAVGSRLAGCTLISNIASGSESQYIGGRGGGLLADRSVVTNCAISENIASPGPDGNGGSGGGVNASDSTFTNCRIFNNSATWGWGAGVAASRSRFVGCTITGNSAYEGMWSSGSGGVAASDSTLERCTVTGNSAMSAGGIGVDNTKLIRCVISGNSSASYVGSGGGGGIATNSLLLNCLVTGNSAGLNGGGLVVSGGAILNSTIAGNKAELGGGLSVGDWAASPLHVTNTIIWGNKALKNARYNEIYAPNAKTLEVVHSDVAGGWPGTGNLNSYPIFITPRPASEAPTTAGDYHIWNGSPCIDRGRAVFLTASDFDGDPRPYSAGYDIGADEVVPRITVKLPNGGEVLKRGTSYKISWSRTVRSGTVSIALYKGSSLVRTITRSTPNTGYFLWSIPATLPAGRDYRVRVYWNTNTRVNDISDRFFTLQ